MPPLPGGAATTLPSGPHSRGYNTWPAPFPPIIKSQSLFMDGLQLHLLSDVWLYCKNLLKHWEGDDSV